VPELELSEHAQLYRRARRACLRPHHTLKEVAFPKDATHFLKAVHPTVAD
jgi:hypothetical protein